jgi:membrane protein required for colicin V production
MQAGKPTMWYDLLTLGILMYAMFRGATKGIVWQLATIAALLMCFFFSGSLSHVIAPFIRVEEPLNKWIAMLVLYLVFSFVCFGAARVLHEAIESMRIEALDRHMGALLGLVKGGMFSLFLTFFLVTLSNSARESITRSESGYVAAVVIDRLDPVIPGDLHALLEPYLRRLDAPGIELEHREDEYARRNGDDRDDPFVGDDRADDRRDGRLDGDRRNLDARRDGGDRPFDDDRRKGDRRLSEDGPNALDRRDDGGVRRGGVPDRPRDDRDSAFDDPVLDAPGRRDSPPRPALDGRSDVADDFRDSTRGDRRREIGRDDDLGTPNREESDWLSSLPAAIDQELRSLARKAWRATKPEHRGELSRRLSSTSVPDMIRKTLRDWENGRPAGGSTGDSRDERAALERQIVRSLSGVGVGSDQRMAAEDIEATLGGIPDDIALNVLRDWRTDLRDQKSDRDPREIDGSSLVRRIRRALTGAGISVRSLDSATQDRLRLRGGELR